MLTTKVSLSGTMGQAAACRSARKTTSEGATKSTHTFRCFRPQQKVTYYPYCDDFGPMSLASIANFIRMLDQELESHPECRVAYCVDPGRRGLTNAVFLIGAYTE